MKQYVRLATAILETYKDNLLCNSNYYEIIWLRLGTKMVTSALSHMLLRESKVLSHLFFLNCYSWLIWC